MRKFLEKLFSDDNNINEKSVIGFISFIVMIVFSTIDLIFGIIGKNIGIEEFIYNSFLILTLGALGIGSVDKYINKNSDNNQDNENSE